MTPALRLAWSRVLTAAQRYPEAIAQLETTTRAQPDQAPPWLMLGALHLELRHFAEAEAALQRYVALAQAQPAGNNCAGNSTGDKNTPSDSANATTCMVSRSAAAKMASAAPHSAHSSTCSSTSSG